MCHFTNQLYYEQNDTVSFIGLPEYKITKEFGYFDYRYYVIIPVGFITDLASLPWPVRNWIHPDDKRIAQPAVLHDYCCRIHNVPRLIADEMFFKAMKICKCPWWIRIIFFTSVRIFAIINNKK